MNATFEEVVKYVEESMTTLIGTEIEYAECLSKSAYRVIAGVLQVHGAGESDISAYREYLKRRKVHQSKRTANPLYWTVLALVPPDDRRVFRQKITYYAQAAFVLTREGIEPNKAADWLDAPGMVNGKEIKGVAKACAMYRMWERETKPRQSKPKKSVLPASEGSTGTGENNPLGRMSNPTVAADDYPSESTPVVFAVGQIDDGNKFWAKRVINDAEVVKRLLALLEVEYSYSGNDNTEMRIAS